MGRKTKRLALALLLSALALVACDEVMVFYSDTEDLASLDWAFQWYAQEPGGPLYGPFDSLGTGVVRVDTISTDSVHLTQKIQGFVFTFVSVPSRPILFYTGDASQGGGVPDVTVSVEGATLDHELLLFCPFVSWWSIDQSPDSRPQSTAEQLVQRKWYPRRHPIPSHAMAFGSGSLP